MSGRIDPERQPRAWLSRPAVQRACGQCGAPLLLPTSSARYCSPACREIVGEARRLRKQARERGRRTE
jgi:predicted nucleic acid-binding Zn ribbon protein